MQSKEQKTSSADKAATLQEKIEGIKFLIFEMEYAQDANQAYPDEVQKNMQTIIERFSLDFKNINQLKELEQQLEDEIRQEAKQSSPTEQTPVGEVKKDLLPQEEVLSKEQITKKIEDIKIKMSFLQLLQGKAVLDTAQKKTMEELDARNRDLVGKNLEQLQLVLAQLEKQLATTSQKQQNPQVLSVKGLDLNSIIDNYTKKFSPDGGKTYTPGHEAPKIDKVNNKITLSFASEQESLDFFRAQDLNKKFTVVDQNKKVLAYSNGDGILRHGDHSPVEKGDNQYKKSSELIEQFKPKDPEPAPSLAPNA